MPTAGRQNWRILAVASPWSISGQHGARPASANCHRWTGCKRRSSEKKFRVVAINEDRRGAAVAKPFLAKLGLTRLALYIDTRLALAQALGLRGMPTSYLIDPSGRVIGALTGPAEWDSPEAKALIGYYLGQGK